MSQPSTLETQHRCLAWRLAAGGGHVAGIHARCVDRARCDAIDSDAVGAVIDRHRPGQRDDRALRGRIGGQAAGRNAEIDETLTIARRPRSRSSPGSHRGRQELLSTLTCMTLRQIVRLLVDDAAAATDADIVVEDPPAEARSARPPSRGTGLVRDVGDEGGRGAALAAIILTVCSAASSAISTTSTRAPAGPTGSPRPGHCRCRHRARRRR